MNSNIVLSRIKESIHSKDPKAVAFLFGFRARGDFFDYDKVTVEPLIV